MFVGKRIDSSKQRQKAVMQTMEDSSLSNKKDRKMEEKQDIKGVYLKWLERSYYCTVDLH